MRPCPLPYLPHGKRTTPPPPQLRQAALHPAVPPCTLPYRLAPCRTALHPAVPPCTLPYRPSPCRTSPTARQQRSPAPTAPQAYQVLRSVPAHVCRRPCTLPCLIQRRAPAPPAPHRRTRCCRTRSSAAPTTPSWSRRCWTMTTTTQVREGDVACCAKTHASTHLGGSRRSCTMMTSTQARGGEGGPTGEAAVRACRVGSPGRGRFHPGYWGSRLPIPEAKHTPSAPRSPTCKPAFLCSCHITRGLGVVHCQQCHLAPCAGQPLSKWMPTVKPKMVRGAQAGGQGQNCARSHRQEARDPACPPCMRPARGGRREEVVVKFLTSAHGVRPPAPCCRPRMQLPLKSALQLCRALGCMCDLPILAASAQQRCTLCMLIHGCGTTDCCIPLYLFCSHAGQEHQPQRDSRRLRGTSSPFWGIA